MGRSSPPSAPTRRIPSSGWCGWFSPTSASPRSVPRASLLFGRRSKRRSLAEGVPENSEYAVIRDAIADLVGAGGPGAADPRVLEVLAHGFWSSIHGMAVLQLTHLAGFGADFATAHRLLLEGTARSWQRADWTWASRPAPAPGDYTEGN